MQNNIAIMEKELRVKKMDAHVDEMRLNKLKLLQKADKIEAEVEIAEQQIAELKKEIESLKQEMEPESETTQEIGE